VRVKDQLDAYFEVARFLAPLWTVTVEGEERQHLPPDGPVFCPFQLTAKLRK